MVSATIIPVDLAKSYVKATARSPIGSQSSVMPSSQDSPIRVSHEQRFVAMNVGLEGYSMSLNDKSGSISK